jgi:hypothetical protein
MRRRFSPLGAPWMTGVSGEKHAFPLGKCAFFAFSAAGSGA